MINGLSCYPALQSVLLALSGSRVVSPLHPVDDLDHVPGDYVLSIDISASMGKLAPVPPSKYDCQLEYNGMTVLAKMVIL